jgi:hypothetical protein
VQVPDNVILSAIEEAPVEEIVAKTKTRPEITVDMSDF